LLVLAIPKVEKEPDDQIINQDETLKVKIPIIDKGPFTLNVRKDGEDIPASSYRISELDGTIVFTIPSKSFLSNSPEIIPCLIGI